MKRIITLFVFVFFISFISRAQSPTFSPLVVAAGNGSVDVTFNVGVARDVAGTQPLTAAQFAVTVSASTGGGTVAAGAVSLSGVTHTATQTTATLSFTIAGVKDGSEIITVKAANATSIYSTTGTVTPMAGTETITANLLDQLAPTVSDIVKASTDPSNAANVNFTVTFSEPVDATTLTTADFDLTLTGGVTASVNTVSPATGTSATFTVNVNTISNNEGTLQLNKTNNAYADAVGNSSTATFSPTATGVYTIDRLAPTVSSIVKASTDPSNATNVDFTVTFSEPVDATTITTADFNLTLTGGVTATVNTVSPSTGTSTTFTVNVNAISNNQQGTLRLNKTANAYKDVIGNSSTATFTPTAAGVYTIDRLAPTVSSIVKASTDPSNAANVDFTVTFSEPVDATTITTADFDLTLTGGVTAAVNTVSPSTGTATVFTVNVNTISVNVGTLRLNKTNDAYTDVIGNSSTATFTPTATGVYTIDRVAPTITSINLFNPATSPTSASTLIFRVTFSEAVTGVAAGNFTTTLTNITTGTIVSVTGSGTTYDVTVPTVAITTPGTPGTVRLDAGDVPAVTDAAGNSFTGTKTGDQTYTIDQSAPVADAPDAFQTAQTLQSGLTSTSQVRSDKAADIYLVRNGTAVTSQAQIDAAVTAKNAFLGKAGATANTGYTITTPAVSLINDGAYNIVAIDALGNVSAPSSGADSWLTIDNTVPTVTIARQTATPSTNTTLNFVVTFSEPVTGVDLLDFVLHTGSANDAIGTLASVTPNTSSQYTVQVSGVVGQYISGAYSILNLDFDPGATITDAGANAFAGTITGTEQEYEVDNTAPVLSPDQMSLKLNGTSAETITFNLNEELNVAEGASVKTGFTTSTGSISTAIYSGKGTTNTITMTSAADNTWNAATTVSYVAATGMYKDIIGNSLQNITNHPVIVPLLNLSAGDVAFTSFRSDDTDQFSVVLLRSIPANTQIYFTDRGWKSTGTPALKDFSDDGLFIFTSNTTITAGTEIVFTSNGSNNFSCSASFGAVANDSEKVKIKSSGDEILVYQTDGSAITFLTAIQFGNGAGWEGDGDPDDESESAVPAGLSASQYILAGNNDNGAYLRTSTASTFTGSATELRALLNNTANWDRDDDPDNNVNLPGDGQPANWALFPVLNNPGNLNYVIRPKINSVDIPDVAMKIGSIVTATISVDDDIALTPVTLTSGTVGGFTLGSFTRTNATTYTAQFTVTEGGTDVAAASNVPIANLVLQNGLGNSNPAFTGSDTPAGTADAIDANSPYVVSINRNSATTANAGTTATSVVFRITFSENMTSATLTAADFSIPTTGVTGTAAVGPIAAVTGTSVFDVTVSGYSGTGTVGLNYVDSEAGAGGSVTDIAGNQTKSAALALNGSLTGQVFNIVLPTPTNEAFTVTPSNITSNAVTLTWNSSNTAQIPTHFLVLATPTTPGTFPAVADGGYVNNGPLAQNLVRVAGTNTYTFNGLNSGTSYNFIVYKYTLSPNNTQSNIDFETTAPATANGVVTNSAALSTMLLNSTPVPISSIKSSSGNSVDVMQFTVYDDGLDPISPNVMSLQLNDVSQETITFTLRDQLTLAEGANVTGFSSSTGAVATAVYSGKGTTNTITLTSATNGTWNSATTVSYAASGNAQFLTLDKMQAIASHVVVQGSDVVQTFTTSGSFVVPAGVTRIQVEAWGAGGSGGDYSIDYVPSSSGGGGGGSYSRSLLTVTPGSSYNYTVGTGGTPVASSFCCSFGLSGGPTSFGPSLVVAPGGNGGLSSAYYYVFGVPEQYLNYGLGGSGGTGDVKFSGGNGGFGSYTGPTSGGGGGSSAGTSANGIVGNSAPLFLCFGCVTSGGFAPTDGGNGGSGIQSGNGGMGTFPGGGGGGVGDTFVSGAGADGQIRITYSSPALVGTSDWDGDNSPFKFSQLVIDQGTGNAAALANWQNVIAGAELSDGTTSFAGTVNATNITFASIPSSTSTDVGFVPDASTAASSKTYTLKVWLRDDLNNTLAATIDGLNLAFKVDPAKFTYDDTSNSNQKSSRFVATQPTFESGSEQVTVVASKLVYKTPGATPVITNPQAQIGVNIPFSSNVAGQDPEVYALDANNNLDLGYNNAANITNPLQSFGQSVTTASFSNGKLALNPFFFTTGSTTVANTQLVVTGVSAPAVTPATSTNVWPVISTLTTISAAAGTEPASISSLTNTLVAATVNFDFTVTDDAGANGTTFIDNDALPTLINQITISQGTGNDGVLGDWSKAIAGAQLALTMRDGSAVGPTSVTLSSSDINIGTSSITFSNIPFTASTDPGRINDGKSNVYTLKIYLKTSVDPSIVDLIDEKDFVFAATDGGLQIAGAASASSNTATSSTDSGDGKNVVDVTATRLDFTTQPPATVDYDITMSPVPVVKAHDANQNLDLGYSSAAVLSAVFVPAAPPNNVTHVFPLSGASVTFSAGVATLSGVAVTGPTLTGINNDQIQLRLDDSPNIISVASAQSSTVILTYSSGSDIVRDGFTYPTDIVTINNREATDLTFATSVPLERFLLRDGGASNDTDGSKTRLQSITLNLTNYQNIQRIALYDETNAELKELDASDFLSNGNITFSSFLTPFETNDDDRTTKKFTVGVSFKNTVTDNQQINVTLVSAVAGPSGSQFVPGLTISDNPLGATKNKVEVVATQLDFTTQPFSASVNVPVTPQIIVSARDANANLDADFIGTITATGNTPIVPGNTFVTANDPTGAFSGGQKTYPSNFQFTVGDGDVQLTITAGGISGTSSTISSVTSYDSWLYFDPTFSYAQKIDFANKQEDPTTGSSQALGRLILSDGGSATSTFNVITNPNPGSRTQSQHADTDGSFTRITDLTISLSNYQDIRKIALYASDGVTKIGADQTPAATVTFNGLGSGSYDAADNGIYTFYIRASFAQTVTDLDQVVMQVTGVTHNSGSKFSEQMPVSPPATVGGVDGATTFGDSSPLTVAGLPVNQLDVIATSLDFVTPASDYAGVNEKIGPSYTTPPSPSTTAAIVNARDKFANIDVGFNYNYTISGATTGVSTVGVTSSPSHFINGILDLDGMMYTNAGDGTLKVIANSIDSSVPTPPNSIPGQTVNVLNVTASLNTNSVLTSGTPGGTVNIRGGTLGAVLLGVTFTPDNHTTTEPAIKKFYFTFDTPYKTISTTILKNFHVTESLDGTFNNADESIFGATVTQIAPLGDGNFTQVLVDWGGSSAPLYNLPHGTRTYYLIADVDVSASVDTPTLTPGFTASYSDILVTKGTVSGTVSDQHFKFASTRPPVLLTTKGSGTKPYNGQLNVDLPLNQIDLKFDVPVVTYDGKIELWKRSKNALIPNTLVATLPSINGVYGGNSLPLAAYTANPLSFSIPPGTVLDNDTLYFINIAKGQFNKLADTGTGISDGGFNFYGGISYNGTLYFKISSQKPPELFSIQSSFTTKTGGSFSTKFSSQGTGYYLVMDPLVAYPHPTAADIKNPTLYKASNPLAVKDSNPFPITQVSKDASDAYSQFVNFSATLTPGADYDIWLYAENDATPAIGIDFPYGDAAAIPKYDYKHDIGRPTLQIHVPSSVQNLYTPVYIVCPDSYFLLTEPIIISEQNKSDFTLGGTQDFNLLLPTGYQFNGVDKPIVELNGADFDQSSLQVDFINNTLVSIKYKNNTSTSFDKITIRGLKVIGLSGSVSGNIKRFGGNAVLPAIPNLSPPNDNKLATIAVSSAPKLSFTNSYSVDNDFTAFGFKRSDIINAIPDDYGNGVIKLTPLITTGNDYGASFFSGTGVTNDQLSLSGVSLDAAFDITMTHTDQNGCVSNSSSQYLVYDHKNPITIKLGQDALGNSIGTKQAVINPNFQTDPLLPPGYAPTPTFPNASLPSFNYSDLAGYELIDLYATIPTSANSQIITGTAWASQVSQIPKALSPSHANGNSPTGTNLDYQWDYTHIINAVMESGGVINKDPYDNFKLSVGGQSYWTGGSLGEIEFTGRFQSTADPTVIVPIRQQVELFVPPIPLLVLSAPSRTLPSGVSIYCDRNGPITITGYPGALAGTSTGTFTLTSPSGSVIANYPGNAFADNGNGTATLNPYLISGLNNIGITNGYADIKITYTYQDNNSPVSGTTSTLIRITPNPVAKFNLASDLTASIPLPDETTGGLATGKASVSNAYCAGIPIIFDPAGSSIAADLIASYNWDFGDFNSATRLGTSTVGDPTIVNNYPTIGTYQAKLTVVSDQGCASINTDNFTDITVGSIPVVDFSLIGISTADQITFTDKTSTPGNGSNSFSKISTILWNYGDGISNSSGTHQYTAPGHYKVRSIITTAIGPTSTTMTAPGCIRSYDRNIVILDKKTGFYEEDFEAPTSTWQFIQDSLNTNNLPSTQLPSWKLGTPSGRVSINSTPDTGSPNSHVWATGLTGTYSKEERSFIYSPVIDMRGFLRPMISFDANWDLIKDGVVMEYSTDNKNVADPTKKWVTVGNNTNGVEWFNDQVIGSKPGKQPNGDYGWSGTSKDAANPTGWVESKHELLNAIAETSTQRDSVVFRFAFATINDGGEGFAFDNFRVGERTRTILLENFTTTNGKDATQNSLIKSEDEYISNQFVPDGIGTTVVKLNYHIGFTGSDPFNLDDPADPSARALYYNVKDVPWAFLDGSRPSESLIDPKFSVWSTKAYDTQTLQLGQVDISVPTLTTNIDGSIKFNVLVKALYDLPVNTIVHVAIIEKSVIGSKLTTAMQNQIKTGETTFDFVLKKMLPNALGSKFANAIRKGDTETFPIPPAGVTGPVYYEYYPDPSKLYPDPNDLAIIIFLQNESTKSIYQTLIKDVSDPPVVTGIDEPVFSLEDIAVYPNPADNEFILQLPAPAKVATRVRLADQVGKLVYDAFIPAGSTEKKVYTQDFAAGIYILQVEAEKGSVARKKVLVTHNK